jgi:LPXTG-motif cell wall-anchored protein
MNKKVFFIAFLLAAIALFFSFQTAFAHTTVHVGNYDVEVGWVDEPPIVGQRNAVVVNVSNTTSPDAQVDISKLTVSVTYGGQTKTLTLQPLSEDTTNQYTAPILPMVPGQYTVQLRGQLDTTDISQDVTPEEVVSSDELAFPNSAASQAQNTGMNWSQLLSILGVICGLAGLILGFLAFRRTH